MISREPAFAKASADKTGGQPSLRPKLFNIYFIRNTSQTAGRLTILCTLLIPQRANYMLGM